MSERFIAEDQNSKNMRYRYIWIRKLMASEQTPKLLLDAQHNHTRKL